MKGVIRNDKNNWSDFYKDSQSVANKIYIERAKWGELGINNTANQHAETRINIGNIKMELVEDMIPMYDCLGQWDSALNEAVEPAIDAARKIHPQVTLALKIYKGKEPYKSVYREYIELKSAIDRLEKYIRASEGFMHALATYSKEASAG